MLLSLRIFLAWLSDGAKVRAVEKYDPTGTTQARKSEKTGGKSA
jgi:hypothetical protein